MKSGPITMKFGHKVGHMILNDNLKKNSFCDLENDLERLSQQRVHCLGSNFHSRSGKWYSICGRSDFSLRRDWRDWRDQIRRKSLKVAKNGSKML